MAGNPLFPTRPLSAAAGRSQAGQPAGDLVSQLGARWQYFTRDPIRKLAFNATLVLLFLKFSLLHEYVAFKFGRDTYLVLLFGVVAMMGMVFSGALGFAFRSKASYFWLAFGIWLLASVPFSFWLGGSVNFLFKFYFKTIYFMFFLMAGLPTSVSELRKIMLAIAGGILVSSLIGRSFAAATEGGRMEMQFGSIKNSGDLAMFFVCTMPFLAFIWQQYSNVFVRLLVLGLGISNLFLVLNTATRASLVTIASGFLFILLWASLQMRIMVTTSAILLLFVANSVLPRQVLARYATLWGEVSEETVEAVGSEQARRALADRAFHYTLHNPVLGVGPGAFVDYDAFMTRKENPNQRPQWQVTHNSYLEVAVETGLVGFFFYIATMISSFAILLKLFRQSRNHPKLKVVTSMSYCMMVAIWMMMTFMFFLSQGYSTWPPLFAGFAVGLVHAVRNDPAVLAAWKEANAGKKKSLYPAARVPHQPPAPTVSGPMAR